ncbi:hypothetical protein ANN_07614 [Periplaneta americana]|uniref:Uncharacterized protein n=1 Tax=Periplaneta americana TaxID=6978 RepID=A0ABQ8T0M4_PERAM|nr:hypothetical protein ANN_07614 [Periplaneta americana]
MAGLCQGGNEPSGSLKAIQFSVEFLLIGSTAVSKAGLVPSCPLVPVKLQGWASRADPDSKRGRLIFIRP